MSGNNVIQFPTFRRNENEQDDPFTVEINDIIESLHLPQDDKDTIKASVESMVEDYTADITGMEDEDDMLDYIDTLTSEYINLHVLLMAMVLQEGNTIPWSEPLEE